MTEFSYPTAFDTIGDDEREAMARVLDSGKLTMGPEVKAFEAEFAAFHGKRHAVMCNSGSSANLLMVAALCNRQDDPLRPGEKVLVPAIAWSTTYAPLVQYGLDLRLCDVDETWNASGAVYPDENIRLIVGCSILGVPGHMSGWRTSAKHHGAYFIEDNCESIGARDHHGKLMGTYGLMSSSSFFWSHQVNGIEGGMVLTDDDELATLCRQLRAHGWTRDTPTTGHGFESEYDFRVMGFNVRPLELHAAVARVQLGKLNDGLGWRQVNAEHFYEKVGGRLGKQPYSTVYGSPSMFGIQFVLPKGARSRVVEALRAAGVDCRLPTGGSFRKHAYGARWANQATPNADMVHERGLFIGNAPFDIRDKVERAADIVLQVTEKGDLK